MSHTYCHTHSAYDCQTCADEILSLGIQVDKDRIAALERELERLRKKLASAEREREQSNARLHEVAVACATAERERDDAHEIIDQYKGMAARYKACMDERDELRKDAELGKCIHVKFRLMKGSTAVRFLGCLGVNEPEGGFDWSKTVLELIDAAIAQGKGE